MTFPYDKVRNILREDDLDFAASAAAMVAFDAWILSMLHSTKAAFICAAGSLVAASLLHRKHNKIVSDGTKISLPDKLADLPEKLESLASDLRLKKPTRLGVNPDKDFANADVHGILKPTLVYFCSLVKILNPAEIFSVAAHELTHIKMNSRIKERTLDVLQAMAVLTTEAVAMHAYNTPEFNKFAGLFLGTFFLIHGLETRYRRHNEFRADMGAFKLTGDVQPIITTLDKMEEYNSQNNRDSLATFANYKIGSLGARIVKRALVFLYSDHPNHEDRKARLRAASVPQPK